MILIKGGAAGVQMIPMRAFLAPATRRDRLEEMKSAERVILNWLRPWYGAWQLQQSHRFGDSVCMNISRPRQRNARMSKRL